MTTQFLKTPKRILFATVPGDGHVNPLTGLAIYLQDAGYDVRWYTSITFADKLKGLNIQHYPLKRALDLSDENLFPESRTIKSQVKKLVFDLTHGFILRAPEYFEDIKEIYYTFPFDIVVCDCAFTAIPFIREGLKVPVISIGVLPLTETSKDLPPMGLGMTPSNTFFGRRKQDALRYIADKVLFRKPNKVMADLLQQHDIKMEGSNLFDSLVRKSTLLLQSGSPGFEYKRSDLGSNVRFVGALLPYTAKKRTETWYHEKLSRYEKVILVTQGTVEKDVSKIIIPTLEAFKNTEYLVVATTGGSKTGELQKTYAHDNIIIEDFIPFSDIMPHAHVYVTNGGYGGVMLSIQHQLPMVAAGVHEGKNEICARVGYFSLGINLRTEQPTPAQLKRSVMKVLHDETYKANVKKLSREFASYQPNELVEKHIREVLSNHYKKRSLLIKTQ